MFRSIYTACIPVLVLIIFGLQVILSSPDTYAQGMFKTSDVPGGSGGTPTEPINTADNGTTLIIVGAVVIAGILVYTLVLDKDKSKKEEKQDTTSQQSLLLNPKNILTGEISKHSPALTDIPVNIYLGFQNIDPALSEKKFIMGISYKF